MHRFVPATVGIAAAVCGIAAGACLLGLAPGGTPFGVGLHAAAAALCCAAARLRGAARGVELDMVAIAAVFVPVFGPALAWTFPPPRGDAGASNAHAVFEEYERATRGEKPIYTPPLFTGDFDRDLSRELNTVSYVEVLRRGTIEQKRNLLRSLGRLAQPRHLAMIRKCLLDDDHEIRLCAYAEIDRLGRRQEAHLAELKQACKRAAEAAGGRGAVDGRGTAGGRGAVDAADAPDALDALEALDAPDAADATDAVAAPGAAGSADAAGGDDPMLALAAAQLAYAVSGILDVEMARFYLMEAIKTADQVLAARRAEWRAGRIRALAFGEMRDFAAALATLRALPPVDRERPEILLAAAELAFARRDFAAARLHAAQLRKQRVQLPAWLAALGAPNADLNTLLWQT